MPYVSATGLGGVCAVVGAGGNIGAVCWGLMFKFAYPDTFDRGYEAMGYAIAAASLLSALVRVDGHPSLCADATLPPGEEPNDLAPPTLNSGDVELGED